MNDDAQSLKTSEGGTVLGSCCLQVDDRSFIMLRILMIHFSVLLHRGHLIHTYVEFNHLRCLTLTHHSSCPVIGSLLHSPAPSVTDPNTPLSPVLD